MLKATTGEEFSFQSIRVELGASGGSDYRLVGYLNGSAVGGATQNFTAASGSGGTLVTVSDAAWQNLDEIRIVRQNGNVDVSIYIDDITVGAAITAPSAPTIGTATAGNTQASVTFTAPASNGGSAITGYAVSASPSGITAFGTASPITVSGLTNGTSYTFTVTADNAFFTSSASAASNSVTPATVPGAPTIGTATAGNAQASVTFTAPASTGGSAITGYTVTSSPGGFTGTGSASPIAVTGLTNGTAYTFTVTATNSVGTGSASSASNSVTPATVPGAPTIGTATAGDAQASITFTAPASNGGSAITGYTVTSSPGGITGTGASSPITVTGLTNGTAYTFTVTATNSAGTGSASSASNSATPKASQTITFANPGAKNFGTTPTLSATSDSSLTVTFTSLTPSVATITSGGTLTFLTAGTATIQADQAGNGSFLAATPVQQSFTVNAVAPGAPTVGTATAGNTQASVTFTAPASNGGATITGYTVTASPGGATGTGASSPITVTGLTNGTAYTFTVTATNSAGTGSASSASNSVTPKASQTITFASPGAQNFGTTPTLSATSDSSLTVTFTSLTPSVATITSGGALTFLTTGTATIQADQAGNGSFLAATPVQQSFSVNAVAPGAPTIGTASAGDSQANVTFTAPASNGGATITGYTVTSNPGGITGTGSASPIAVSGLTNGVSYTFTVTATNSAGTGSASAASNSVTPNPGPAVVSVAVPANGSYGLGSNLDFTVTWDSNVIVTGTPRIAVTIGATTVQAQYVSSPTATTTLFRYTVQAGQTDTDGITIGALTLNGGTIRNGSNVDATLTLNSVASTTSVLVDTTAPTLSTFVRQSPTIANTVATSVTWRLTFSENVTGVDVNDFTLTATGTAAGTLGTVTPVSASIYDVTATSVAGVGSLRLALKGSGTGITDIPGNALSTGATNGPIYVIGSQGVFDTSALTAGTTRSVSNATTAKVAQRFTTSASAPLALSSVTAWLGAVTGTPTPVVTINANNAGVPGTVIATLTNPSSLTANAANTWTNGTLLTANTTYWIVFADSSVSGAYTVTETASTNGGGGTWLTNPDYVYYYGVNAGTGPQAGALLLSLGAINVPSITSTLTASATYGSAITPYTIAASNSPSSFGATGLPTGLSLAPSTGVISGTPMQAGSFNVSLTATNSGGTSTPATLVLTVAKATLTVTANNQSRNVGASDPTFTVSYSGFVSPDTASSLTTQPTATTTATSGSPAGTYPIVPAGGVSSNYTFSYVNGTLTVSTPPSPPPPPPPPAPAPSIALRGLNQVYNGTPRSVTATTSPAGLGVVITYNGSTNAPTDAGSYGVQAVFSNSSLTGVASGSLLIAKAEQTISFATANLTAGSNSVTLSATASSGLPVTLSVVSGNGTLSGSSLTFTGTGSVTVRATQAGNTNVNAVSVDQTIAGPAKLAQTIAFAALADQTTTATSVTLSATASSGLPVSFTLVSGPATLSGGTLTLSGTEGTVEVRASQAGNATYNAAADVTRSFAVTASSTRIFIGDVVSNGGSTDVGDIGAVFPPIGAPDSDLCRVVLLSPSFDLDLSFDFRIDLSGHFVKLITIDDANLASIPQGTPPVAAAIRTLTVRGQVTNGLFSGTIDELKLSFSVPIQTRGSTTGAAGFYQASTLNSANGATYAVVGNNGEVLVVARTGTVVASGRTTLASNGTFSIADGTTTVSGSVNAATSSVAGTVSQPGKGDVLFSGTAATATRLNRLANLSSRNRVGTGARALITGFVVSGAQPKRVLIRAAGPALSAFNVTTALRNPRLQLFRDGQLVQENDDWRQAANATDVATTSARIGAFPFANDSRDSAILTSLPAGSYTAIVADDTGEGVGLAEIYDASETASTEPQRLVNISTRGESTAGEGVLIGGIVVTGNTPKRLLIRGVGPALAGFGVTGALADSALKLYDSSAKLIAQNDNWETPQPLSSAQVAATGAEIAAAAAQAGAFALTSGSRDSAIIVTLAAGNYTAHVTGATTQTGVALIEVYELP